MFMASNASAQSVGGCSSYIITTNGANIVCNSTTVPSATSGVISTQNDTTVGNNTIVTIDAGTTLRFSGSTVGVGAGSTIVNNGTLNTNTFTFGYGLSIGVNGRSQAGGGTITNNGSITTAGTSAAAIKIYANSTSSTGNSITNTGTITTTGNGSAGASESNGIYLSSTASSSAVQNIINNSGSITTSGQYARAIHLESTNSTNTITNSGTITTSNSNATGIYVANTSNVVTINNSGTISTSGASANAIYVTGAANVTNSGTICAGAMSAGSCVGPGSGVAIAIDNNPNTNRTVITNSVGGVISAPSNFAISSTQLPGIDIKNYGTISTGGAIAINFSSGNATSNNSVTLYGGSTLIGGISFNTGTTAETLNFNGYVNSNFNNTITGLNVINVTNGANVTMSSISGYNLVAGQISVDATSNLVISGVISDQTTPVFAASSIYKTGDGMLSLTAANTYTGDTVVAGGTLGLGNSAAVGTGSLSMNDGTTLRALVSLNLANVINLSGNSTIDTNGYPVTLSGVMSGTGGLTKIDANTLTITNTNTYTGATNINAGKLVLNGSLTSNTTMATGTTLQGSGTINGSLTNNGTLQPSLNGTKTNFTVVGNYTSNGGVFVSNLYSPSTNITADTLTISGASSIATGATQVNLLNQVILGLPTTGNGIPIVNATNGAQTGSSTFFLPSRIAVGAFEYQLIRGGTGAPASWFLATVNTTVAPVLPPTASGSSSNVGTVATSPVIVGLVTAQPGQRVEATVYPAIPTAAQLYLQTVVDSLDQRRGDLVFASKPSGAEGSPSWIRLVGQQSLVKPGNPESGPGLNTNTYALQIGLDVLRLRADSRAQTYAGPFVTLGQTSGRTYDATGSIRTGTTALQGYSMGLAFTHFQPNGLYVDTIIQGTRFSGAYANSVVDTSINSTGWGLTGSVEAGFAIPLTERLALTPQGQIKYNSTRFNGAEDAYSQIVMPNDNSLVGRVGLKLTYENAEKENLGAKAWVRVSGLTMLAGQSAQTVMQGTDGRFPTNIDSQAGTSWMALDGGLNVSMSKNSQLYLNVGYSTSLNPSYQGVYGRVGVQLLF